MRRKNTINFLYDKTQNVTKLKNSKTQNVTKKTKKLKIRNFKKLEM